MQEPKLPNQDTTPKAAIGVAPVLLVPDVLPPEFCRALIDLWEGSNVESGSMVQRYGKTVEVHNYDHKIRRDHSVKNSEIDEQLKNLIGPRIFPEIRKAFAFDATRREDFRVAGYDSTSGGYFRPHRDNTTEGTAHRRFAMSLLLNDDYEGGYLRFPEYGDQLYRPTVGSAIVFSCSLRHEATDVTVGRRFVLISFFYGNAEAKQREEYAKRVGDPYRA